MGVRFMEHILILTQDPAGTRDWWCQTLGLREGDHPDFGFPVHWLYIGDQDVIHTCQANYSDHQNRYLANARAAAPRPIPARSTSLLQLRAHRGVRPALRGRRRRLQRAPGVVPAVRPRPDQRIKVELNFAAEEAKRAGRQPTRTAADAGERPATIR